MPAIHDRERPLPPHERRDAREGRLEERAVADDAAVLLGDGRAGDQPGERLEPGAIAPGEHEGPETVGGGRFHSPLSMRRWARTFRAARRAREGPIRVVTLRPRQDEAEAVRRARDVLLDRRLLGDQAAERVAEPVSAREADRAVVAPRPHLEELDLHVEVLDPGEVVP